MNRPASLFFNHQADRIGLDRLSHQPNDMPIMAGQLAHPWLDVAPATEFDHRGHIDKIERLGQLAN